MSSGVYPADFDWQLRVHPSQTQEAQVSVPTNEDSAAAEESVNQRRRRRKKKLIRLDDLIPKQDAKGGRQLLFGATETTQTTDPTKGR
jgi:hypothetical protein